MAPLDHPRAPDSDGGEDAGKRVSQRPPGGPEALVGTVLAGRYRIEKLLGEGGMGAVYRAEHTHIRKRLAIKVLHAEMSRLPEVVARFEREAMAAAHIEHPNVAAATDFGKLDDGSFFLVLEYIEGRSLRDDVVRGALDWERGLRITRQIALALQRAHGLGIVHRDLKPENVMLIEKDGDPDFVKVLDFGIAKVPVGELVKSSGAGGPVLTQLGMVYGTPEYMAPEQALGQAVDARADIYSLGIMLYEMLSGSRPFEHASKVTLLGMHVTAPVPRVADKNRNAYVPEEVEAIVKRCLEKESGRRFESARDLVAVIEPLLGIAPASMGGPMSQRRPSAPDSRESLDAASVGRSGLSSEARSSPSLGSSPGLPGTSRMAGYINTASPVVQLGGDGGPPSGPSLAGGFASKGGAPLRERVKQLPRPVLFSAIGAGAVFFVGLLLLLVLGGHHPTEAKAGEDGGGLTASSATVDPALAADVESAKSLVDDKHYTNAEPALTALVQRAPERADVHALLERVFAATKRGGDAISEAKTAIQLDPTLRENVDLQVDVRNIALGIAGKDAVDPAFDFLEHGMGEVGPDILYDIAFGPGTKGYKDAATRARASLDKPDVVKLESPALRVTVDLYDADGCAKAQKFAQAGELGDARTLAVLKPLRDPLWIKHFAGKRYDGAACLHSDGKLDAAIAAIEARGLTSP